MLLVLQKDAKNKHFFCILTCFKYQYQWHTLARGRLIMNNKASSRSTSKLDFLKWILVVAMVPVIVVGNQLMAGHNILIRIAGILTVSSMALVLFFSTARGRKVWQFFKESWVELRKIVWPSRQETMQSTLMILVMVFLVSIMLWVIDNVVIYCIGLLTGLGGA